MTSPHELARAYDQYAAALWRGNAAEAATFAAWLEGHWANEASPEPDDRPNAVSVLGGAGAGIRWYARGGTIVGYVAGRSPGCYLMPVDAAPPSIHLPWGLIPRARDKATPNDGGTGRSARLENGSD